MAATDYDFFTSRTDIIARALRLVGAIGEGDPVNAEQNAAAVLALNQLVKSWQNKNVFLWTVKTLTMPFVASTASYTLPAIPSTEPAILWVDRAFYRDSVGHDGLELAIIPYREYQEIVDKAAPGRPSLMALNCQPSPTAYFWPVPNAADTLFYEAVTRLQDWDNSATNSGFDPRWDLALTHGLAHELAPENGITSVAELQIFERRADRSFTEAKGGHIEHTTRTHVRSAFPRRH